MEFVVAKDHCGKELEIFVSILIKPSDRLAVNTEGAYSFIVVEPGFVAA